ncbi:MAG: hypothetical protein V3V08_22600, partial [Nannocystaceae bacterium]
MDTLEENEDQEEKTAQFGNHRAHEAAIATGNGRGSWWNSMSPAMQGALGKALLARWGLLSLVQMRRSQA